jgi:hypothetical protein
MNKSVLLPTTFLSLGFIYCKIVELLNYMNTYLVIKILVIYQYANTYNS